MNYYSTKDMCKIFGVGRETLRHYENVGLLHPAINPDNGYRTYGYWDLGNMIDILKYKSVGFSLSDTKSALFDMEFSEIVDALEKQQDYYRDKLVNYMMLDKKTAIILDYLKNVRGNFDELHEFDTRDIVYIPYNDPLDDNKKPLYQKIFQNSLFFSTAWIFKSSQSANETTDCLGFVTEKEFADFLGLAMEGEIYKKAHAIGTLVDIKGHVEICQNTFQSFENEVQKKYPEASNDTYALLVSRFYDNEQEYHQYIFVYKRF